MLPLIASPTDPRTCRFAGETTSTRQRKRPKKRRFDGTVIPYTPMSPATGTLHGYIPMPICQVASEVTAEWPVDRAIQSENRPWVDPIGAPNGARGPIRPR